MKIIGNSTGIIWDDHSKCWPYFDMTSSINISQRKLAGKYSFRQKLICWSICDFEQKIWHSTNVPNVWEWDNRHYLFVGTFVSILWPAFIRLWRNKSEQSPYDVNVNMNVNINEQMNIVHIFLEVVLWGFIRHL